MARRPKGTGSIVKRGRIWFVQYYHEGQRQRESSHSQDKKLAQQLLQKRLFEIATGQFQGLGADKVTIGTLIDLVIRDYHFRKLKNAKKIECNGAFERPA